MMRSDFCKPEYRDNYYINEGKKALWYIELELFREFDSICKRNQIDYFLIGGALLGAVRHKGFIPWDDDIDIGMLRKDYDKFLKMAVHEFRKPYFVQTGINDPDYFDCIIRIRDSNTTGIIRKDKNRACNNGVFIEIFPFDDVNPNRILLKLQRFMSKYYRNILHYNIYPASKCDLLRRMIEFYSKVYMKLHRLERVFSRYQYWSSRYSNEKCEYVDQLATIYYDVGVSRYKKEDLIRTISVDFEYLKANIPIGYDNVLRHQFGDYMKLPPEENRGKHHNNIVFYNPFLPYSEYCKTGKQLQL